MSLLCAQNITQLTVPTIYWYMCIPDTADLKGGCSIRWSCVAPYLREDTLKMLHKKLDEVKSNMVLHHLLTEVGTIHASQDVSARKNNQRNAT